MKLFLSAVVVASVFFLPMQAFSDNGKAGLSADIPADKQQLINEYFKYVPMNKMLNEMAQEVASQMPPDRRKLFIDAMTKNLRVDVLEQTAKTSLAKHLTMDELRMYVEFIKRPEARSAMDKMKFYMADMMPVIQQEVLRSVKQSLPAAPTAK